MIKYLFLFIIGSFVALFLVLYFKLGGYKDVKITGPIEMEFKMLYKEHRGPYHKINSVIEEVEAFAKSNDIQCTRSFGEFIDNPDDVEEDRLRSHAGCLVEKNILSHLPDGIVFKSSGPRKYAKAVFLGAPSIGPLKVYPKLEDWFENQRTKMKPPIIEVYEVLSPDEVKTEYYAPYK